VGGGGEKRTGKRPPPPWRVKRAPPSPSQSLVRELHGGGNTKFLVGGGGEKSSTLQFGGVVPRGGATKGVGGCGWWWFGGRGSAWPALVGGWLGGVGGIFCPQQKTPKTNRPKPTNGGGPGPTPKPHKARPGTKQQTPTKKKPQQTATGGVGVLGGLTSATPRGGKKRQPGETPTPKQKKKEKGVFPPSDPRVGLGLCLGKKNTKTEKTKMHLGLKRRAPSCSFLNKKKEIKQKIGRGCVGGRGPRLGVG